MFERIEIDLVFCLPETESVDMKTALNRMWRNGLFKKLMHKTDNKYWIALFNYYNNSKGIVDFFN